MRKLILFLACLSPWLSLHAAEATFPPACPRIGTMNIIDNPSSWADICFQATNGRLSNGQEINESNTIYRDMNLDGTMERLEIRGVGNKLKQIYVFDVSDSIFRYMGELNAHPVFYVARDSENDLYILNIYRAGANEVYLQKIKYIDGEYQITQQDRMQ